MGFSSQVGVKMWQLDYKMFKKKVRMQFIEMRHTFALAMIYANNETLATVAITRGNSRSVFSLVQDRW